MIPSPLRSPAALSRFFLVAAAGLTLDLWSKSAAFANLEMGGPPYVAIPKLLEFQITENHGAVFGMGQGYGIGFICISFLAIAFLIYLFASSGNRRYYQVLLGLLLAGVMGNLYDRMFFGYVRDMIHIFPHWPNLFRWIFNLADTYLCVGVGLIILYNLKTAADVERSQQASQQNSDRP